VPRLAPLLALVAVFAGGCGARNERVLARNLRVDTDFGQLYVYDPATQEDAEYAPEERSPLFRALDDATRSRRFVGVAAGLMDVSTASQYAIRRPLRLEVWRRRPPFAAARWDHVVELSLPVPSGRLAFEASGGGPVHETSVPPGTYRVRFAGRGYVQTPEGLEGKETYLLQLWPAPASAPTLVKYWHGFDTR
jgi:hypothetical protein